MRQSSIEPIWAVNAATGWPGSVTDYTGTMLEHGLAGQFPSNVLPGDCASYGSGRFGEGLRTGELAWTARRALGIG